MFKSGLGDLVCSADTSTHQMGPSGRGFAPADPSDLYLEDFGVTALTETPPQAAPTPKPQLSSSFKPCSGRCLSQVEQLSPISVPRPSPAPCSPLHRPLAHQLCRQDQARSTTFCRGLGSQDPSGSCPAPAQVHVPVSRAHPRLMHPALQSNGTSRAELSVPISRCFWAGKGHTCPLLKRRLIFNRSLIKVSFKEPGRQRQPA